MSQNTTNSKVSNGSAAPKARPALDPLSPALTQPFKDLVGKGVISALTVTFTPMGVSVSAKASQQLADVKDSGVNTTDSFPVAKLLALAESSGLHTRPGKKNGSAKGPTEVKPQKSLVAEDMKLSVSALQKRCNEIAAACGGGPLVGRVRSEGAFKASETQTYRQWWDSASPKLRLLSLTEGKRRGAFDLEQLGSLGEIQCPFRGTLEFIVANDDDDSDGEGPIAEVASGGKGKGKSTSK